MKNGWIFFMIFCKMQKMWRKKQRKILFFLLIGCVILFIGLMVEFVIYRYSTNRSAVFRAEGNSVQIFKDKKWQQFAINAVNMGPQRFDPASGNIAKDEYARRFKEAAAADVNVIRIFSVQPPSFYQAFFEYNMLAAKPIYLLHGIVIEDYFMNAYEDRVLSRFFDEIRKTVDIVHGSAAKGVNSFTGVYNLDISPYVMGYILFCDMDDDFIVSTNDLNTHIIGFEGDYLYTENASPWEAWFAGVGNFVISYEQDHYKTPYRLLSWSVPEAHSRFYIAEDEIADFTEMDFMHIRATEKFNSGFFTSAHSYPDYPDLPSVISLLQP